MGGVCGNSEGVEKPTKGNRPLSGSNPLPARRALASGIYYIWAV
jgi:hypothetical protein